ncbi:MAG: hypothetical protein ABF868_06690 [Sporolactobacillus sp.]
MAAIHTGHVAVRLGHESVFENTSYFIFSIILNALGNALTITLNLGSALWTASAVNVANLIHVSVSYTLFAFGVGVIFANSWILRKMEWRRVIGNLIFMVPFSVLIGLICSWTIFQRLDTLPLPARVTLDFIGVALIAMAISIYQRVNFVLHPCDELMQIVRFKFFNGSAAIAQSVTFLPPVLIVMLCWIASGRLYAINAGTVFALLFQGALVDLFDRRIFPSLKHRGMAEAGQQAKR